MRWDWGSYKNQIITPHTEPFLTLDQGSEKHGNNEVYPDGF